MAAYGLYTHIASNKFRSMLLLAGLVVWIYVLVYAGALVAEVVIDSDRSVNDYLMAASRDLVTAFPYATAAAVVWIVIAYFFHQSIVDAVTGGEDVTRQQQPRLYNLLENLCISRGIRMRRRNCRRHRCDRTDRAGLAVVAGGEVRAVAIARTARRRRLGRVDEESGRHDLRPAQDREPRRASRRDLGGDGIMRRQPARGICRPVCHPSFGGFPCAGAGQIRGRTRSRTAGAAVGSG